MSDQEAQLFREAMRGVKPLKKPQSIPQRRQPDKRENGKKIVSSLVKSPQESLEPRHYVEPETVFSFKGEGVQIKTFRTLQRGAIPIEATLDLHRRTSVEAYDEFQAFIERAKLKQQRSVLIVHGKGLSSSAQKPILKSLVYEWLLEHREVLAFHSAKPKDGGTGAVYVLIRRGRVK